MLGLDEDGVSPRHPRRSDVRQRATGGEASKEKALQVRQPKKQRAKSRTSIMAEATTTTTPPKVKSKPAASAFEMPKFEMPKFEMPKFEIPKVEMPAAFREFAERGVAQCKDT
ncbi:MAG TPA: hypothetical protein VN362_17410, partial [Xanthobacteraceae bacterium]|nr:hypothetical protein [Xanthobacteraceae bacterium]